MVLQQLQNINQRLEWIFKISKKASAIWASTEHEFKCLNLSEALEVTMTKEGTGRREKQWWDRAYI